MSTAHQNQVVFTIHRSGPVVRVVYHSELDVDAVEGLRAVLRDLIEAQGNLTVALELRDVAVVDLRLLGVIFDADEAMNARGGSFSVTTRSGMWEPDALRRRPLTG